MSVLDVLWFFCWKSYGKKHWVLIVVFLGFFPPQVLFQSAGGVGVGGG